MFADVTQGAGRMAARCQLGLVMKESHLAPAVLSNLQISVGTTSLDNPSGEIYGKVVESGESTASRVEIRFASVTPELKAWLTTLSN